MKFKQLFKQLMNEEEVTADLPASITTAPHSNIARHDSGVLVQQKRDFYARIFLQFKRDLDQHYADFMREWVPIEQKMQAAEEKDVEGKSISSDALEDISNIRKRIQMIENVFKLENRS